MKNVTEFSVELGLVPIEAEISVCLSSLSIPIPYSKSSANSFSLPYDPVKKWSLYGFSQYTAPHSLAECWNSSWNPYLGSSLSS